MMGGNKWSMRRVNVKGSRAGNSPSVILLRMMVGREVGREGGRKEGRE